MQDAQISLRQDLEFGYINNSVDAPQLFDPRLIANSEDRSMSVAIQDELRSCNSFKFSIAFISSSGLAMLKQALLDFKGHGTIITSRYLDFNEPRVFRELLTLKNVDVRIYDNPNSGFHPKGYLFEQSPILTAIIGSSNLTETALVTNQEWNLRFSTQKSGDIAYQIDDAINRQLEHSVPLTEQWIKGYEESRQPQLNPTAVSFAGPALPPTGTIRPNQMQAEALAALDELREKGEKRAVIISATGTGKTILAALAVRNASPNRVLFVVHREQIAAKAAEEFKRVLNIPEEQIGRFTGQVRQVDRKFVFATSQTICKPETLAEIPRDQFDFIIIDESHHSGSESFRRIINHFTPLFLLGLTATPERTDSFNIFELFDYNVAYEIRLQRALEEKMLVPFHYFGVSDYTDANGETITETSDLARLASNERCDFLVQKLEEYGRPEAVKGLIFCSRKDEAHELSQLLNRRKVFGRKLRTVALTGADKQDIREREVKRLENGEIDYILTVDIFNEGIDIPAINQIVMLRNTQSSIIFTQQLGRGLRKSDNKDHVRIIDFIGNYTNNFLIPIALFGDNSRNKDTTRKNIVNRRGAISGVSTVNFDPIAESRILASLAKARLSGVQEFKQDILNLQNRLNRLPKLIDFARFETVDPVIIATKFHDYWTLLSKLKLVAETPTPAEAQYCYFLANELLNGKRPHELLILRNLLDKSAMTTTQIQNACSQSGTSPDDSIVESALNMLSFDFLNGQQTKPSRCGLNPVILSEAGQFVLAPLFKSLYEDSSRPFAKHVDDIIETGLFLARERGTWEGTFKLHGRYSRKDVCRLLNWSKNLEGVVNGYMSDLGTATCPIFITYHKRDEVDASVSYEDRFINPKTMHWYSKSKRTLESKDVRQILDGAVNLHVFVKKDNAEGTDFYYLGPAVPANARQEQMPGNDGKQLNVVSMDLILDHEVDHDLYNYLESSSPVT